MKLGRLLAIVISLSLLVSPVYADNVPVSASVPSSGFNPPTLIAPLNNTTLNITQPTFSWNRPSPNPGNLQYYDFYLDDAIFAASISDSLTSQDFYFYYVYKSGNTFYLTLKTDLSQGYHNWKVVAYNSAGISEQSETRVFYIDSIPPFIVVNKVGNKTVNWNTLLPNTLPKGSQAYITVNSATPDINGQVETYANIQLVLLCPTGVPSCSSQTYSSNAPDGTWTFTLNTLIPGKTYTAKVSATDASSNTTIFPDFFITYGPAISPTPTPTVTATVTPTATLSPTPSLTPLPSLTLTPSPTITLPLPSVTVTPPPGELNIITPTPFVPVPPSAPTPPPQKAPRPTREAQLDLFYRFLLVLMIFGLPAHLLMSAIGVGSPIKSLLKFFSILAFPFLRPKKYQTTPFSFIVIYISDKLDHPWQSVVSDIQGYYSLKNPIPENLFISIRCLGRKWKDILFKGSLIPVSCLIPLLPRLLIDRVKLQKLIYELRVIPLVIAILTSITALIIRPGFFVFIYFYLSIQYFFSEYIYPRI